MSDKNYSTMIDDIRYLQESSDHFFLLLNGILVFLMQCGFAFLEAGSVRAKNTTNILIKNLLDIFLGAIAYWAFGYAFAFGDPSNAFIGYNYFFFAGLPSSTLSHFFFHFVFAATAATIVSGAMAERTEFKAYMIYSIVITGIIYPIVSHWAWSGTGWLASAGPSLGYQDFAGSSVVHMVGGTAALVGAAILGPRKDRFTDKEDAPQGHNVPLVALGGFILFFGFFAFNGGSQASISNQGDGEVVANAIVNTIICGSSGALVTMILGKLFLENKKWSLLLTINGGLTGMVAICAGCNSLLTYGAAATGAFSGVVFLLTSFLMVKLKIDDPLDAVAVHLGGGLWGILTVPLLAYDHGVFYAWDVEAVKGWGWNALGACVIIVWTGVCSMALFGVMFLLKVLRVDEDTEMHGLDVIEHEVAYPRFSNVGHYDNHVNHSNGTDNLQVRAESTEAHVNPAYASGSDVL